MIRIRHTEEQIIAVLNDAQADVSVCPAGTGRRFKCFTMINHCSKEVPVIEVDDLIGGSGSAFLIGFCGPLPEALILNYGLEFTGTALHALAELRLDFIFSGRGNPSKCVY